LSLTHRTQGDQALAEALEGAGAWAAGAAGIAGCRVVLGGTDGLLAAVDLAQDAAPGPASEARDAAVGVAVAGKARLRAGAVAALLPGRVGLHADARDGEARPSAAEGAAAEHFVWVAAAGAVGALRLAPPAPGDAALAALAAAVAADSAPFAPPPHPAARAAGAGAIANSGHVDGDLSREWRRLPRAARDAAGAGAGAGAGALADAASAALW
jgi:hypothetical protein